MNDIKYNYDFLFEASSDLLCIAGFDGYFKKINKAVSDLLGYSMEELYSRPINDFIYPEDQEITQQHRAELVRKKPLRHFENRYLTKSGEIVWLSWTSHRVEEEQVIFAIAKNITHKKKQDADRNALLAGLSKINKDLHYLNFTTSHDLRSPVNNLLSLIKMLDVEKISDPDTKQQISLIQQSGDKLKQRLDSYVDRLLEKHRVQMPEGKVNLEERLKFTTQSLSSLIDASGAIVLADFSLVPDVKFNQEGMDSVLLNLISNSIKYAQPGKPTHIFLFSDRLDGKDTLIVQDNGLGFDMEKVGDKIFGLNQRFHKHSDGKGLGLYLVHNHITAVGGTIKVESKVNEGARFIMTFPG